MAAGGGGEEPVLVVDDEDVALRSLARIVAGEGFSVVTARNGEKAAPGCASVHSRWC